MKSNLKSSDWLIHFINPNRGIGPIFDNFEDNWVGIRLTWDETFLHARDKTHRYLRFFLPLISQSFAVREIGTQSLVGKSLEPYHPLSSHSIWNGLWMMFKNCTFMILSKKSLKRTIQYGPYCMLSYCTRQFYSVLNGTFVNVKYQVQLANIFKTPIQGFNKYLKLSFLRINSIKLTCIRSSIPSSDSDESTQKMK